MKINLNNVRNKIYSQFQEDGITEKIFELIGTTNKICIEFGVENSNECCSRILWEKHGFKPILFDNQNENINRNLTKETITIDNVLGLFIRKNVPEEPDFLCIDIDSYDFYVTHKILSEYSPRLLIVEINPFFGKEDKVIRLDSQINPAFNGYHGASAKAWYESLKEKYDLVSIEQQGINAFFVKKGLLNQEQIENFNDFEKLYIPHTRMHFYRAYPEEYKTVNHQEALSFLK